MSNPARPATAPPNPPVPPLAAVAPERVGWWSLRHHGRVAWYVHLGLLAIFALLALVAHGLRADTLDVWITGHVQQLHWLNGLMQAVSWPGYSPQDFGVFAVIIVGLFALGYRVEAIFLLVAVLGSGGLGTLVKTLVARPRPTSGPSIRVLEHFGGYSFPSGHVLTYVSFFGFLAYVAWIEFRHPLPRWLVLGPCIGLLILVGPSRIYLAAHWASDVLGAYFLGGIWLSVVLRLYVAWLARTKPQGQ